MQEINDLVVATSYSFDSIILNGQTIGLKSVLAGTAAHTTEFERETLDFLREWLEGKEEFLVKTSGSTGTPKSIHITRKQMEQSARATIKTLNLPEAGTALVCLHTRYVAGKMMIVRALINNMRILAIDPSSNPLEKIPEHHHIDFTALVPLQLQTILHQGLSTRLSKINTILIGGAALDHSLRPQINLLKSRVFATYGMTETITHVALQEIKTIEEGNADYFVTLPGVTISADDRGCLVVAAPYLPEPVITNDIVEIYGQNKFRWLGRIDNIINTGGVKVIPEHIERTIGKIFRDLGITRRFFVAGQRDELLGERIVLFIEGSELSSESQNLLVQEIHAHITTYEAPREIRYSPAFIYTETGKVNTKETLRRILSQ